jgi:hypothetical protein
MMGISQIISATLLLLLLKWGNGYIHLLQTEHQSLLLKLNAFGLKLSFFNDLHAIVETFEINNLLFKPNGIWFHDQEVLTFSENKWRLFYPKISKTHGKVMGTKLINVACCDGMREGKILLFTPVAAEVNTALVCSDHRLKLLSPLRMDTVELNIIPLRYKEYLICSQHGKIQIMLKHVKDTQHLLDINRWPHLIIQAKQVELSIGKTTWHFPSKAALVSI